MAKMGYSKIFANKHQIDLNLKNISDLDIKLIGINTIEQAISQVFE